MPNIKTMGIMSLTAGYLISEANGMYRSRDQAVVTAVADMPPGTILGTVTVGGAIGPVLLSGSTGQEVASGILWEGISAGETAKRTITKRDCEVNGAHLVYPTGATVPQKATINAALAALGIIVR